MGKRKLRGYPKCMKRILTMSGQLTFVFLRNLMRTQSKTSGAKDDSVGDSKKTFFTYRLMLLQDLTLQEYGVTCKDDFLSVMNQVYI